MNAAEYLWKLRECGKRAEAEEPPVADKSRPSRNAEAAEPGKRQAGAERERDANLPAQAERPGAERSGMVLPCLPIAGAVPRAEKGGEGRDGNNPARRKGWCGRFLMP